ncbi:MAG: FeoB-associated Cys-rich membrane protein [Oscillospiraceae bacterium]
MLKFLSENIGTVVTAAILLTIVFLIIRKVISDKKKGVSSCGGGCAGCPNCAVCHPKSVCNAEDEPL